MLYLNLVYPPPHQKLFRCSIVYVWASSVYHIYFQPSPSVCYDGCCEEQFWRILPSTFAAYLSIHSLSILQVRIAMEIFQIIMKSAMFHLRPLKQDANNFHFIHFRITLCASIYLIISVAIERYIAVCRPHHYREVQSDTTRSVLYILPSLCVALGVNCSR